VQQKASKVFRVERLHSGQQYDTLCEYPAGKAANGGISVLPIFETAQRLSGVFSPPGQEGELAVLLRELVLPYADECRIDCMGNLVVRKEGGGKRILLSCHMDTAGIMVTYADEDGFFRFSPMGSLAPEHLQNAVVRFPNGSRGMIRCSGKAEKTADFWIDTMQEGDAAAPGAAAVFDGGISRLESGIIQGAGLFPRLSCAVLLNTLSRLGDCESDIWVVFSAQGELGYRCFKAAAWGIEPDLAIDLAYSEATDFPGGEKHGCRIGGGVGIRRMDPGGCSSPEIVNFLEGIAKSCLIPYQADMLEQKASGVGSIQHSRAKMGVISIPVRYRYTSAEMAAESDAAACSELMLTACSGEGCFHA